QVAGFGIPRPYPARWELTLTFKHFSTAPSKLVKKPLAILGAVQFNFVSPHAGSKTVADGLFRGFLQLGGAFGGSAELYGEVEHSRVVSLVVTSGHHSLLVGKRRPRQFVSYTSTVAGSTVAGLRNGPGKTARFDDPKGVAVGPDGTIYVADSKNN